MHESSFLPVTSCLDGVLSRVTSRSVCAYGLYLEKSKFLASLDQNEQHLVSS